MSNTPISRPLPRETDETWRQVIYLFRKHGLSEPPVRLRDELVVAFEWAWHGVALQSAAETHPSPYAQTMQISAADDPDRPWEHWSMMPVGDQRNIIREVLSEDGQTALAYFTGKFMALAPVSDTPVELPFKVWRQRSPLDPSAPPATNVLPIGDNHPDALAVDRFAAAMKAKLAHKRAEGRAGWENKEECSAGFLSQLLREHVEKGDPIDVANFCMMLHQRGDRISPAPQPNVRAKPLEWKAVTAQDRKAEVANSVLGKWEVWQFPAGGSVYIMKPGEHQGAVYEDSYEEAKAYMERVYQRRMAPALAATATESPLPPSKVREE